MILTMARPDERKNLEMLVRVYGESEQLAGTGQPGDDHGDAR